MRTDDEDGSYEHLAFRDPSRDVMSHKKQIQIV